MTEPKFPPMPTVLSEAESGSPNFVPAAVGELAARGHERVNAWPRTESPLPPDDHRDVARAESIRTMWGMGETRRAVLIDTFREIRREERQEERARQRPEPPVVSSGLPPSARLAVQFLLTRIGSWTHARWDQHLRHEVGDVAANTAIRWIEEVFDVKGYGDQRVSERVPVEQSNPQGIDDGRPDRTIVGNGTAKRDGAEKPGAVEVGAGVDEDGSSSDEAPAPANLRRESAQPRLKASELGEAAFLAYFRKIDEEGDKRKVPQPDWSAISAAKRSAWVRAALAVAHLVNPTNNEECAPSSSGGAT